MANSLMQIVSDGSLSTIPLTIDFFEQSHVTVYINDVALPSGGYTAVWSGATTITITPAVAAGLLVSIRRRTPSDYVLHNFQAGAVFSELSVDENFKQDLFLLQEASEQSATTDIYNDVDLHLYRVRNMAPPLLSGDAATKGWVDSAILEVNGDYGLRSTLTGPDDSGLDDFFGGGGWADGDKAFWNFYSNPADPITNALRQRFSLPVTDEQGPILWLEKKSSVTRADGVSRWDNGALYASLLKESGSAFGTALTGAVRYTGGSGDAIAMHGRVQSEVAGAQSFAGWFMNSAFAGSQGRVVGIEVDARSYLDVLSWRSSGGVGQYTVINCTSGGGTYGVHEYIRIPPKPAESEQRAWTGILFGQNTIHITDTSDNGEAVRIRGSSFASGRYGGIAIGDASDSHFMTFGLRMVNADFAANRAIQLADGHRMYWGANLGSGSGKWVEGTATNLFNIQNMSVAMNGVKVLAGRQTGIFQLTGTADGATKNTETMTLVELARYVKRLSDAGVAHGFWGPT